MREQRGAMRTGAFLVIFLGASLALGTILGGCGIEPDGSEEATKPTPAVQNQPAALPSSPATVALNEEPAAALVDGPEAPIPSPALTTPVLFTDAEAAYHEKHYADAVDLFEAYVQQKPANPWGFYMLGLSAWKAGQLDAAGNAFEAALALDPKHQKSLLNWSRVLLEQGEPEEALTRIKAVLELDPASNEAYRLLARTRDAMGETDAAVEAYKHALTLDEDDAWSMNNLAFLWIRQGREADALPALARAVQLRADVAVFQNNLGVALERTGHAAAATRAYRDALNVDATYAKASTSLARVEALQQEPSVETSFLSDLAQGFAAEVQGWRQSTSSQTEAAAVEDSTQILDAAVSRSFEPQP